MCRHAGMCTLHVGRNKDINMVGRLKCTILKRPPTTTAHNKPTECGYMRRSLRGLLYYIYMYVCVCIYVWQANKRSRYSEFAPSVELCKLLVEQLMDQRRAIRKWAAISNRYVYSNSQANISYNR